MTIEIRNETTAVVDERDRQGIIGVGHQHTVGGLEGPPRVAAEEPGRDPWARREQDDPPGGQGVSSGVCCSTGALIQSGVSSRAAA